MHFTFAPEDADKAEALFRELRAASRAEADVIAFEVGRGQEDPNIFALWEVYKDRAAFDAHKATDHYGRLVTNGVRQLAKARSGDLLALI